MKKRLWLSKNVSGVLIALFVSACSASYIAPLVTLPKENLTSTDGKIPLVRNVRSVQSVAVPERITTSDAVDVKSTDEDCDRMSADGREHRICVVFRDEYRLRVVPGKGKKIGLAGNNGIMSLVADNAIENEVAETLAKFPVI